MVRLSQQNQFQGEAKVKKLSAALLILTLSIGITPLVLADCYKDGKPYPTGTVIDGFICTADGTWVKA